MNDQEHKILRFAIAFILILIALLFFRQLLASQTSSQKRMAIDFYVEWPQLRKTLQVSPSFGSGQWLLDGVQVIGSKRLLAQLEDGYFGHVAVVNYDGQAFAIEGVFKGQLTFSAEYYDDIIAYYGEADYRIKTFKFDPRGRPIDVTKNLLVK